MWSCSTGWAELGLTRFCGRLIGSWSNRSRWCVELDLMSGFGIMSQMWHAPVPVKIKNFTWKCFHGFLPTATNLKSRKVDCGAICGWCQGGEETTRHALVHCGGVWEVCDASVLYPRIAKFMKSRLSKGVFVVLLTLQFAVFPLVWKEEIHSWGKIETCPTNFGRRWSTDRKA